MVRSAAAVLAVLILPAFVGAQQAPTSHTVVDGDTLWDLAQRFYADPFDWRLIWEANQDEVPNPNLILPGQVLDIPGGTMAVVDADADPAEDEELAEVAVSVQDAANPAPQGPPRTVFYREGGQRGRVVVAAAPEYAVVPRDVAFSAPWLIPLETEPQHIGRLARFAGGAARSETPRTYDQVLLESVGTPPAVGSTLRIYRVSRTIESVGEVVLPTGLLTVTEHTPDGALARVTQEYDRIQLGDFVGPVPSYRIAEGDYPMDVSSGPAAMVMGFAGTNEVQDIGSVAFLDVGADQGIVVGDEFEYRNPMAGDAVEGRLQVVSVRPGVASARVMDMDDAVFEQGIVVRLSKKMR